MSEEGPRPPVDGLTPREASEWEALAGEITGHDEAYYQNDLPKISDAQYDVLRRRLEALAEIRSEEGYMAEVRPAGRGAYLLIENHCPICAAAGTCVGLCDGELSLFEVEDDRFVVADAEGLLNRADERCVEFLGGDEVDGAPRGRQVGPVAQRRRCARPSRPRF